jgi:hypothetical protein
MIVPEFIEHAASLCPAGQSKVTMFVHHDLLGLDRNQATYAAKPSLSELCFQARQIDPGLALAICQEPMRIGRKQFGWCKDWLMSAQHIG